jgi:oxygen-independent coproporphyrinogen-3 oxidase
MCWYCGCHTSITKRNDPIVTYVGGLRTEAHLVAETIGGCRSLMSTSAAAPRRS